MFKNTPLVYLLFLLFIILSADAFGEPLKWKYVYHGSSLSKSEIKDVIKKNDIIGLTGFTLYSTGKLRINSNKLIKTIIKNSQGFKCRVYPVINFSNPKTGSTILNSDIYTKKAIIEISRLLKRYSFRGINLDFEYLPPADAERYGCFLKELKRNIKSAEVTIAVFPRIDFPGKWSDFHNPKFLKNHTDCFVLMLYDQHRKGTPPGPVADFKWVESNIRQFIKIIPASKLILGIPAYGYTWNSDNKCRAISARYAENLAKKYGYRRDSSGNMTINYYKDRIKYKAYISDRLMRKKLKRLSAKYNLKGWALWRAGYEEK